MLKIYAIPVSLYCAKLRILLRHKGLEWQEEPPPGGYGSEEYKRLVPGGNLPALIHDGHLINDSEAIAEYLNEMFPEPAMLPTGTGPGLAGARADIRSLSRFHDTRLEPAVRKTFQYIARDKRAPEVITDLWLDVEERLGQAERLLPAGPRALTLADCGLPVTCTWIKALCAHFEQKPLLQGKMQAYLEGVSEIPAVSAELAEYRPRLESWLANQ